MKLRRVAALWVAVGATSTVIVGCGGGGGGEDSAPPPPAGPVTISGVVADGPLSDAVACYDLNDNGACDSGEPTSAPSNADGVFTVEVPAADAGRYGVVVNVPATAIDRDTGSAVGTAFTLRSPASGASTVFVSPLSTLVADAQAASGGTTAQAEASIKQQLGLAASPLANYVSASDSQAARLARTINQVIVEVNKLTAAAGVPADQAKALVASVANGNLPALAALASAATGTPAEVAAQVATQVLADRNLNETTVAAQSQVAQRSAQPLAVFPTGPFISTIDFTYADAGNYSYRLFTGDNSVLDTNGASVANELRSTLAAGAAQPFNRNQAYWTGSAWRVCERAWQVVSTTAQTATTPQRSNYCGSQKSESRITAADISGRRMADVVTEMRAFPLPDRNGLPTNWGADPALLGDTTFPADSLLTVREQQSDIGNTERYSLIEKALTRFPDGSLRHAATFDDLTGGMPGNLVDPGAAVDGGNAAFLQDIAAPQPGDPALRPAARFNIAFHPDTNAVRFYKCNVVNATNASTNCATVADGTRGEPEVKGDARVLRIAGGYPTELINASKTQRFFVERNGAVFRGNTDLQRTYHNQRLNTTAWVALRDRLGVAPHTEATAPPATAPTDFLRQFTYSDANNYGYRRFTGTGVADAAGVVTADDHRIRVAGGVQEPFAFNSEFWTGSDWYACPDNLVGVLKFRRDPRDSEYCNAFLSTYTEPVVATIDGRLMSDIVRDVRRYSSLDGIFSYQSWGPNPDIAALVGATFPPGSTYYYQRTDQTREPDQVFLADTSRVRIAPSPTSAEPFENWPLATTLDEVIAGYPGDLIGSTLNGNTALFVFNYFLPAPSDPAFTNEIQVRVAFDANGSKARFYRNNRSASTGFTTNYVTLLDTTYAIETLGGRRLIRFAQTPQEVLDRGGLHRIFVERAGLVRYGQQTRIFPGGQHTIRLNGVAWEALRTQLNLVGI